MKLLTYFVMLLSIMSCSNENVAPVEKTIAGKWEWVESTGGIGGWTYKASATEKKQVIFTKAGDYELIENGDSKMKTKYIIKDGMSITSTTPVPMIYFQPDSSYIHQSYQIKSDTLFLFDEVNDGFNHTYVRIR